MKRIQILGLLLLCFTLSVAAQQTKELVILHTSDTHSRIEPISPTASDRNAGMGGTVRRAAYIAEMRREHPDNLLLFDCGDISQGTPYYNVYRGEVEVKMMNLMGYDAMVIGNHEFDFGEENMARLFSMAHFPVVSANYDVTGTPLEGLVKPYVIFHKNGLKIGVFGLSTHLAGLVQAEKCVGITYNDPYTAAQQMADLLRTTEKCDVVICLSHLGYQLTNAPCDTEMVRRTSGIDLVLGGHSHTFMSEPAYVMNKEGVSVPVLHSGASGVFVGKIVLTFTKE
ncbi:MAG: metallophosphatase [Prevotellaceae bacterium]|jgi:5'-nucleotidase|nr:metallophosphatase [Prevotellaceae bacterium]